MKSEKGIKGGVSLRTSSVLSVSWFLLLNPNRSLDSEQIWDNLNAEESKEYSPINHQIMHCLCTNYQLPILTFILIMLVTHSVTRKKRLILACLLKKTKTTENGFPNIFTLYTILHSSPQRTLFLSRMK